MTVEQMIRMRNSGATYQQIANMSGLTRQRVHQKIQTALGNKSNRRRGKAFPIEDIKYTAIYDYFKNNENESASSFGLKVFGGYGGKFCNRVINFVTGRYEAHLSVEQIKKVCEIVGKPFEEVFKERDFDGC